MAQKRRYLRTEVSGYLNLDKVNRFFVETDVLRQGSAMIKASVDGPQMPFVVAHCDTKDAADTLLIELIDRLESE